MKVSGEVKLTSLGTDNADAEIHQVTVIAFSFTVVNDISARLDQTMAFWKLNLVLQKPVEQVSWNCIVAHFMCSVIRFEIKQNKPGPAQVGAISKAQK